MQRTRPWIVAVALVGCTFDATGLGGSGDSKGSGSDGTSSSESGSGTSTTGEGTDPSTDPSITSTSAATSDATTTSASASTSTTGDETTSSTTGCDVMKTYYKDGDGDGFGDGDGVLACAAPPGYSPFANDCDDGDETVNPGADELCDAKGVDDDCDGLINEYSAKNMTCGTCSLAYFKNTDHVYWFCNASVGWDVARAACQKVGADLVMVGGDGENGFVRMSAGSEDYWLGGRDQDPNADTVYKWVDGSALTYQNWDGINPNQNDGCMAMTAGDDGRWRDYGCSSETFSYACESL